MRDNVAVNGRQMDNIALAIIRLALTELTLASWHVQAACLAISGSVLFATRRCIQEVLLFKDCVNAFVNVNELSYMQIRHERT